MTLDGPVPADRDFELHWTPDVGRAPGAAVFVEPKDGKTYALVMLVPNAPDASLPRMPREATYIIDTSGSMAGTSIVQAKAALLYALDRLAPGDRFNVIEFNSRARPLFDVPMPVDPATLGRARSFVSGLKADGGTEMREALTLALRAPKVEGFVRQIVFLTDGAVGNENELFALIRERLDDRRLFTVGIGSAPNSHFMTKAAQFGRGTFTYIGDTREVQEKMAALFRKLESPVLTDVVDRLALARGRVAEAHSRSLCRRTDRRHGRARRAGGRDRAARPARRQGVAHIAAALRKRQRERHRCALGAREDRGAVGCADRRRERRRHPRGDRARRARASPGQQAHESGRGRCDADDAGGCGSEEDRRPGQPAARSGVRGDLRWPAADGDAGDA